MNTATIGQTARDAERCAFPLNVMPLDLTDAEARVLKALSSKPGVLVTRSELNHALYADKAATAESNVLEVMVSRLRKKFDALGAKGAIHTIRGQGYRFNGVPQ